METVTSQICNLERMVAIINIRHSLEASIDGLPYNLITWDARHLLVEERTMALRREHCSEEMASMNHALLVFLFLQWLLESLEPNAWSTPSK